jgi:Mrp family chromosome partitioning ATPase
MKGRTVVIQSLKGGVGKTTVVAELGLALSRKGYHVGLLDIDITAPKLHKALGFGKAPEWQLDAHKEVIIPSRVNGIEFVTIAGHTGEKSTILLNEQEKIMVAKELLSEEVVWDNLDWLLVDTPPSSSREVEALFNCLNNLYGIILVFQPTEMAETDLLRTFDFIQYKQLAILGVISNMDGCISPQGETFWQFLSPRVDIESICSQLKVPLLARLPQGDSSRLRPLFDELAQKLEEIKPIVFKPGKLDKRLREVEVALLKKGVKALLR